MNSTISAPIPVGLRVRRRLRKLPPVRSYRVVRQVLAHPANRHARFRALAGAARWQVRSRVLSGPMDVPAFGGLVIRCHPRSNAASNVVYFSEYHDPVEMAIVEAWLSTGDLAVDIGANIGTYTLLMAAAVGPTGRVMAFEPAKVARARLTENVELNRLHHVQVIEAAVGREPGRARMTSQRDVSNTLAPGPGTYEVTEVDVRTLDQVLDGAAPALLKIDVEGFEAEVLAGATRTLAARPVVVIELDDNLLRRGGSTATEVTASLEAAGYRLCHPSTDGEHVTIENTEPTNNAVAVPEERWEQFAQTVQALTLPSRVGRR